MSIPSNVATPKKHHKFESYEHVLRAEAVVSKIRRRLATFTLSTTAKRGTTAKRKS